MKNELIIHPLREEDFELASSFVYEGMHLYTYLSNEEHADDLRRGYFQRFALTATYALGAYRNGTLVGFVMSEMDGKSPCFPILNKQTIFEMMERGFHGSRNENAARSYYQANEEMLKNSKHHFDGELTLLAVDPLHKREGIMTALFQQLSRDLHGKRVYLFTDSDCDTLFYPANGFEKEGEAQVDFPSKRLFCYMFSKLL